MHIPFTRIGLFARKNHPTVAHTLEAVVYSLLSRGYKLSLEHQSAALFKKINLLTLTWSEMLPQIDLLIVVGGDGSLLNAARNAADYSVPVLGINRGKKGFLTDILPSQMEEQLDSILQGDYIKEERILLKGQIIRANHLWAESLALNDIVLYNSGLARLMDFEVHIDEHWVQSLQADGLIVATPTGSTAYSLSAGGPILFPTLNAISIVPLCPHILSNRPIVIEGDSRIKLRITQNDNNHPKLSYDGQVYFELKDEDEVVIQKHDKPLALIHPSSHQYFSTLRHKLGWDI